MTDATNILVLDGDMVPALSICRSLGAAGRTVYTGSALPNPIASYSRFTTSSFEYPDPLLDSESFIEWLVEHTRTHDYDLVIPVTERTLVPVSTQRGKLKHVRIAMPSVDSLELALDKDLTIAAATRVAVAVPWSAQISSMAQCDEMLDQLKFPVVIKPARSLATGDTGGQQLKVDYAFDRDGLRSRCQHALRFGAVLLQEYFGGLGVGIELIARDGDVLYAFQHQRMHEVPLTGGGSSLRKSVELNPDLLAAASRLVDEMNWTGVAMVEFKWNPQDNSYALMEVNGRFWGSLPLATAAGADFPRMLAELEIEGEVTTLTPYRRHVVCRKLSSDLHWYEAVIRRAADERIFRIPSKREVILELGWLFNLRSHRYDVQSLSDPIPGFVDVGRIFKAYTDRLKSVVGDLGFYRSASKAWRRGRVRESVAGASTILFICYGNINRSAAAEALLSGYAGDLGVTVESAGFHPEEGRLADPVMTEIAAEVGLDLGASRSTVVTDAMLDGADLIFVMERSHVESLQERHPQIADKVFLLGAAPPRSGLDCAIADPYGKSPQVYRECFRRLTEAVDHIKSTMAAGLASES